MFFVLGEIYAIIYIYILLLLNIYISASKFKTLHTHCLVVKYYDPHTTYGDLGLSECVLPTKLTWWVHGGDEIWIGVFLIHNLVSQPPFYISTSIVDLYQGTTPVLQARILDSFCFCVFCKREECPLCSDVARWESWQKAGFSFSVLSYTLENIPLPQWFLSPAPPFLDWCKWVSWGAIFPVDPFSRFIDSSLLATMFFLP